MEKAIIEMRDICNDEEDEEDEDSACNNSKEHINGYDSYSNEGTFGFEYNY